MKLTRTLSVFLCASAGLMLGSNPMANAQSYCTPTYTTSCISGDIISNVTLNGETVDLNNNSGCSNNNYSNYTNLSAPDLGLGQTYQLSVSTTYDFPTSEDVRVWIDYNDDGTFSNWEQVANTNGNGLNQGGTSDFNFTVPDSLAFVGTHRMRVRMAYAGDSLISPCSNAAYGETEDYTVKVIQLCIAPNGLTLVSLGSDSATISWSLPTSGAGVSGGYDYYLSTDSTMPSAATTPTGNVADTVAGLSNLSQSTTYYFWVRSKCDDTHHSEWSSVFSFSTPCHVYDIPYTVPLDSVSTPHLPECTTVQHFNTDSLADKDWKTADINHNGFDGKVLESVPNPTGAGQVNRYFFSNAVRLNAGVSYVFHIKYGGSDTGKTQKITAALSIFPSFFSPTFVTFFNSLTFTGGQAHDTSISFTMPSSATCYIRLMDKSAEGQGYVYVSDISIKTCSSPVSLGPDMSICSGDSATLHAEGAEQGATYAWNTGSTDDSIIVNTPGTYSVTVTDTLGCTTVATVVISQSDTLQIDSMTVASNVNNGTYTFQLFGITDPNASYFWDFGDGETSTEVAPHHAYAASGDYTVKVTVSNACNSDSTTTDIHYTKLHIGELAAQQQIKLYPNPARNMVMLESANTVRMRSIAVFNILGQRIYQAPVNNTEYRLNVSSYVSGLYNVRIVLENGTMLSRKFEVRK